jgi:hypothetical protein
MLARHAPPADDGHLVDASTSSTACATCAAFPTGPSLVKKRLLDWELLVRGKASENENAPPGTRRRRGIHIAPGFGNSSSHSMECASLYPILHRTFLTVVDRQAHPSSRRRLPSRTLECHDNRAHSTCCSSRGDPLSTRRLARVHTRLPRACQQARHVARLSGGCQIALRLRRGES